MKSILSLLFVAIFSISFFSCSKPVQECGTVFDKGVNGAGRYFLYVDGVSVAVDSATYNRVAVGSVYCYP